MFYISAEEVKQYCHDEKILEDIEKNPTNPFVVNKINEWYQDFDEPAKDLFDWCKSYTLATYDFRKDVNYRVGLDAWDAGFQQIRCAIWKEELTDEYQNRIAKLREYLEKDLFKFGFIKDVED